MPVQRNSTPVRTASMRVERWSDRPAGVPLRAPRHPGVLLQRYCLDPLALSQSEAARLLGMSRRRLHELVHGQRTMTPDTAIRCARRFGIEVGFWLTQQAAWDSFQAWKRQSPPASHSLVGRNISIS